MDIKEAEQRLNKGLADAGKRYYDSVNKIDAEFEGSTNASDIVYRETMTKNREHYNQALLKAETDFNKANQEADDIHRNAPVKAKSDYDKAKTETRNTYEATKIRLEDEFQKASQQIAGISRR